MMLNPFGWGLERVSQEVCFGTTTETWADGLGQDVVFVLNVRLEQFHNTFSFVHGWQVERVGEKEN